MSLEHADEEQRKAFLAEMELMKSLAPHSNIVGLVGCCSKSSKLTNSLQMRPHPGTGIYLYSDDQLVVKQYLRFDLPLKCI